MAHRPLTRTRDATVAVLAAVLAIAAGVALLLLGTGGSKQPRHPRPAIQHRPDRTITPGLTRFSDPTAGFSISYPSNWARLTTSSPQVPLLVSSPGGTEALLVRVTHLGLAVQHVTVKELPVLLPLTNRLVNADPRTHLLQRPMEVDLGGLPGYAYVYTEAVAHGGEPLAHVQYFLFSGPTMIALVFQITDAKRLTVDGAALARVADTFTTCAVSACPR